MNRPFYILMPTVFIAVCLAQTATTWEVPASAKKLKNPAALTGQKMDAVEKLYDEKCAVCHGMKGDSNGSAASSLSKEPADLAHSKAIANHKDGELFFKITTGRAPMPSYESELSEKDRWQLVNYIRVLAGRAQYRYLGAKHTR